MIGIPARSSVRVNGAFAALGGVDVQRVDADARHIGGDEGFGSLGGQERMADEVVVGSPVAGVAGSNQHRVSAEAGQFVRRESDRPDADPVEAHGRHVRHTFEREAGEVVAVGKPVERHVEVGAGVRAHRDQPDLERDARPVDGLRGLAGQVIADRRRRQPRIGEHSIGDHVAEVDVSHARHGKTLAHPVAGSTTFPTVALVG